MSRNGNGNLTERTIFDQVFLKILILNQFIYLGVKPYTNARVGIPPGACGKVTSDVWLGGGFRQALRFPPPVTAGLNHDLAAIW